MPKNTKAFMRRHDGWILDEMSKFVRNREGERELRYKGLSKEDAQFLDAFNLAWTRGVARDVGKLEITTVEERRTVSRNRSRRRRDAQNTTGPIIGDLGIRSPEDALIDAIDMQRDELGARRRIKAADQEFERRERHAAIERAGYAKRKKSVRADQGSCESTPPNPGDASKGIPK